MRMTTLALPLLTLFSLGTGCLDGADEVEVDDVADDAKADGVTRPFGTYTLPLERTDDSWGGISLSIMSDRSYRREEDVDPFVGATIERGTYRFTKSGSKRYIKLTAHDGSVTRFQYKLAGEELQLRAGTEAWATYAQDTARCDRDDDCVNQGIEDIGCYYSACVEVPEPEW